MEVQGQKSAGSRSNLYGHLVCQPCDNKGQQVTAAGYCEDCSEYLCQKCYDIHTLPTPLQHHRLLDAKTMPKSAPVRVKPPVTKSTLPCPKHSSMIVEFYCISHNSAVCGACAHKHHKACAIEDISEVSEDFNQSQEYTEFNYNIDKVDKTCQEYTEFNDNIDKVDKTIVLLEKAVDANIQDIETSTDKNVKDIDKYRDKLVDHIDKLVREMKSSVNKQKYEDVNQLKQLQVECQSMESEIQTMKSDLQKHQQNNNDLYVPYRQVSGLLQILHKKLVQIESRNVSYIYNFWTDKSMDKLLSSNIHLGSIFKPEKRQNVPVIPPISVHVHSKIRSCVRPVRQARVQTNLNLATAKLTALPV